MGQRWKKWDNFQTVFRPIFPTPLQSKIHRLWLFVHVFVEKKSVLDLSGKHWNYPESVGIIRKAFWVHIFRIIPTPLYSIKISTVANFAFQTLRLRIFYKICENSILSQNILERAKVKRICLVCSSQYQNVTKVKNVRSRQCRLRG